MGRAERVPVEVGVVGGPEGAPSSSAARDAARLAEDDTAVVVTDRVLTVPNALSALRLLGVPLFLYLLLGPRADGLALVVLMLSGITDYLDGKLARMLDQSSKLGAVLDPAADRLYVLATLVAFVVRDVVPWWVAAALVGRDLVLAATYPVLRRRGLTALPVHYLGKAATFSLLYAFPLLLAAQGDSWLAELSRPLAVAFTVWGGAMYLWAGVLYLVQVRLVVLRLPVRGRAGGPR